MTELYRRFSDEVEFFVVYVQEAHPTDGWQTDSNIEEGVLFRQHRSYTERESEEGVLFRQHRSYTERESEEGVLFRQRSYTDRESAAHLAVLTCTSDCR